MSSNKVLLVLFVTINLSFHAFLGNLLPRWTPDTSTYVLKNSLEEVLAGSRTPFYGLFLEGIKTVTADYSLVPIVQLGLFCAAVYFLYRSAIRYGLSKTAAVSLSLPLIVSNASLKFTNFLIPDMVAITFILFAMGGVFMMATRKSYAIWLFITPLLLSVSYLFKPGFLLFLFVFPILFFILCSIVDRVNKKKLVSKTIIFFTLALIPFITYSSIRYAVVGNFHIVSYSGYTGLGLSGQIMNTETANKVSEEYRSVILSALSERIQLEEKKRILPLPISSTYGEPVYFSAVLGYFDIFAANYDHMISVLGRELGGTDPNFVVLNNRASGFNWEVIKAEPVNYLLYIVGASTRFFGLLIAVNVSFIISIIILSIVLFYKSIYSPAEFFTRKNIPENFALDMIAIFFINLLYVGANFIPAVALTFPALRYVDISGIFMASIPTYLLAVILSRSRSERA